MPQIIDLQTGDMDAHINQAHEWIRAGYGIAAPVENGYVLLADAFTEDAVRTLHAIRGDDLGVAAQVFIGSIDVLDGIARDIPEYARALMQKFWPGQISFNVAPSTGLSWDLGDGNRLGFICVRVPSEGFVHSLVQKSGPLAVASAALAGSPPIVSSGNLEFGPGVVQGIFVSADIPEVPLSTLIRANEIRLSVLREGAISLEELKTVAPLISLATPTN